MILNEYYQIKRNWSKDAPLSYAKRVCPILINENLQVLNDKIKADYDMSNVTKIAICSQTTFPRAKVKQTDLFKLVTTKTAEVVFIDPVINRHINKQVRLLQDPITGEYAIIEQYIGYFMADNNLTLKDLKFPGIDFSTWTDLGLALSRESTIKDAKKIELLNEHHVFIDISVLENYVKGEMLMPDEDSLAGIDDMLASSDSETVSLGLDLLINYNVKDNKTRVVNMLKRNMRRVINNKRISSVTFKNTLTQLGLSLSQLNNDTRDRLMKYCYVNATNDQDKEEARKCIIEETEEILKQVLERYNPDNKYNLTCEINIS